MDLRYEMTNECVLVKPYFPSSLGMMVATGRSGGEGPPMTFSLETHSVRPNFSLLPQ